MAAKYGCDISGPATTAQEAVQWTYFGYLGAVKSQNGAAMSFGRTATFLDAYFERDLKKGLINISSPIARALIGKEEGDTAEVQAPGGIRRYEVVAVSYV